MILVPLLNPKFATVPAAKSCELRVRGTSACPGKMDAGSPTRTCANSRNREPFPIHLNREWLYVLMMSYISPLATACCTVATPSLRLAFSV